MPFRPLARFAAVTTRLLQNVRHDRQPERCWICAIDGLSLSRSLWSIPLHTSTRILNPPYAIRFKSNGIDFGSIILARRGSFTTFLLTWSRCVRDLSAIHEKTTVSRALARTVLANGIPILVFRSSPTDSQIHLAAGKPSDEDSSGVEAVEGSQSGNRARSAGRIQRISIRDRQVVFDERDDQAVLVGLERGKTHWRSLRRAIGGRPRSAGASPRCRR